MTKQKDRRIRELEKWGGEWKSWAIIFCIATFIGLIGFMVVGVIYEKENKDFRQELQSCQESLFEIREVYQIKFHCEYGWMNQTIVSDYHNYESYQRALKNIGKSGYGDCEVIK